jgi:hypothetical protein
VGDPAPPNSWLSYTVRVTQDELDVHPASFEGLTKIEVWFGYTFRP